MLLGLMCPAPCIGCLFAVAAALCIRARLSSRCDLTRGRETAGSATFPPVRLSASLCVCAGSTAPTEFCTKTHMPTATRVATRATISSPQAVTSAPPDRVHTVGVSGIHHVSVLLLSACSQLFGFNRHQHQHSVDKSRTDMLRRCKKLHKA